MFNISIFEYAYFYFQTQVAVCEDPASIKNVLAVNGVLTWQDFWVDCPDSFAQELAEMATKRVVPVNWEACPTFSDLLLPSMRERLDDYKTRHRHAVMEGRVPAGSPFMADLEQSWKRPRQTMDAEPGDSFADISCLVTHGTLYREDLQRWFCVHEWLGPPFTFSNLN